ncbi:NAD-dependent epimerase [Mucilaginibacter sp. McL0603]|uniref:NAD-dependent epimerase n=1 Tax=Mucilaginibacter sp. McL0603 TaxID=3415670 RepID=UPI003CEFB7FD
MKILVTGSAGFIGLHLAEKLLKDGFEVIGLDNLNKYYDPKLKAARLKVTGIDAEKATYNKFVSSSIYPNYRFINLNLEDPDAVSVLFKNENFDIVCNLAAQAGVRYSLESPYSYISSNVDGFLNLLEGCRNYPVKHFVYASSSSVYGLNGTMPLSTHGATDHPISLYAATKKTNELMAHSYSYLFNIPLTGLRFFTVYGPWGRPDMALFKFTKAILEGKPVDLYNQGNMMRDFTYVDDIVTGITKVLENPPERDAKWSNVQRDSSASVAPYRIYNLGNSSPVKLLDYLKAIENALNLTAIKNFLPLQAGDMIDTYADMLPMKNEMGYAPQTDLQYGVNQFVAWYRNYYNC